MLSHLIVESKSVDNFEKVCRLHERIVKNMNGIGDENTHKDCVEQLDTILSELNACGVQTGNLTYYRFNICHYKRHAKQMFDS